MIRLGEDCTIAILGRRFGVASLLAAALIATTLIDLGYNALRIARLVG